MNLGHAHCESEAPLNMVSVLRRFAIVISGLPTSLTDWLINDALIACLLQHRMVKCGISGSHGDECKYGCLLGFCAVLSG